MQKKSVILVLIFLGVFAIKILFSFLMSGIFIYTDEFCVIQKAMYFIENFEIKHCIDVTGVNAANPFPLYSILISPIYLIINK